MRKLLLLLLAGFFTLGMIGCQQDEGQESNEEVNKQTNNEEINNEENNGEIEYEENNETNEGKGENQEESDSESKDKETGGDQALTIEELGDTIFTALKNKDFERISDHTHPEKGLLITPYIYIEDNVHSFSKEEVANLLEDEQVYTWGIYDGKGTPIELTAKQYFDEFIDQDIFTGQTEVLINDPQVRGNTLNNIDEKFEADYVVEYYYEGSEEFVGMDWESINFVFEEKDGTLYLVAIVGDRWTV